ncbi:MAG: 50S ribosomal protein L22 [Candidatus Peregrinibacteria bacterium]
MKAYLKQVRISPKKINLIASLVRNKKALDAVDMLKFTPKRGAPILKKLIESALANASHNDKQAKGELYIKEIIVTEGPTHKRSVPISKGRSHPILKRTSHISVKLEQSESGTLKAEAKAEAPKIKKAPKPIVKVTAKKN